MAETCKLSAVNGVTDQRCEGERCVYWRAVESLGHASGTGCAVEHYEMLGEEGMAAWLLSVKERVEHSRDAE